LAQRRYDADVIRKDYAKFLAARHAEALDKLEAPSPDQDKPAADE